MAQPVTTSGQTDWTYAWLAGGIGSLVAARLMADSLKRKRKTPLEEWLDETTDDRIRVFDLARKKRTWAADDVDEAIAALFGT